MSLKSATAAMDLRARFAQLISRRALLWLVASLVATGCSLNDTASWKEEVKLFDGRIIVIERTARREHWGFSNAPRGPSIDQEVGYPELRLHWHGAGHQHPISFEIIDGSAYLVITNGYRKFCSGREKGAYRADFLKWHQGAWVEIDQKIFPADRALNNLYFRYWGHTTDDDATGLISWPMKAVRDGFNAESPKTLAEWFALADRSCG